MKKIVGYVGEFYRTSVSPGAFLLLCAFLAGAIAINFGTRFETRYVAVPPAILPKYVLFYFTPFAVAVLLQRPFPKLPLSALGRVNCGERGLGGEGKYSESHLWLLAVFAALMFGLREVDWSSLIGLGEAERHWRRVINTLLNWVAAGVPIALYWRATRVPGEPFYGWSAKGIELRPYWLLLALMFPLVAFASFQPDFLSVYPRAESIIGADPKEGLPWPVYGLFELMYGLDFVFIEFFFRGFLVLAFAKLIGRSAILPMAAFYVFIHFEKPMGEAISSFFGGIILGVVAYETRSIYGGIIVHVGIAWMMELMAYMQKAFRIGG